MLSGCMASVWCVSCASGLPMLCEEQSFPELTPFWSSLLSGAHCLSHHLMGTACPCTAQQAKPNAVLSPTSSRARWLWSVALRRRGDAPQMSSLPLRDSEGSVVGAAQEEVAKRRARADRFQVAPNPALQYLPDEEDEVRRKRAERFAITVTPAGAEG